MTRTGTVGPRNRPVLRIKKTRVKFNLANTAAKNRARRITKKYGRLQSDKGLASTIANLGLTKGSKAINLVLGKKLIDKGIERLPDIVNFGTSKIKNKNIQGALDPDFASCIFQEAQNRAQKKLNDFNNFLG